MMFYSVRKDPSIGYNPQIDLSSIICYICQPPTKVASGRYARGYLLLPNLKKPAFAGLHTQLRLYSMPPVESLVWLFIDKTASAPKAGNCPASCRCCKQTRTQAPSWWWDHLHNNCDGSNDPDLLPHAKTAAAQYFAEVARKAELKARKNTGKQQSIIKLNQKQLQDQADEAIARWVFANGLPLSTVSDFYFRDAMEKVAIAGKDRAHVGRKRLTDALLPAEVKRVKKTNSEVSLLNKGLFGQTLVSDGWTDANGKPLINVLLVCPGGEQFLEAIDTSGETKSMAYIAELLGKHINQDVDLVVMDGACAGAIALLTEEHPWLSGVVCTTHSLDLLMKDYCNMAFAAGTLSQAKELIRFINNHQKPRAMFLQISEVVLLSPANTRFGSYFIMVERLLRCEASVRGLLGSRNFQDWVRNQKTDIRNAAK